MTSPAGAASPALVDAPDCGAAAGAQAASATNKTTQPNVGLKSIEEFLVPLPPLPEHARIVARVAQLRRLCADLHQRLTQSQTALAEALAAAVA